MQCYVWYSLEFLSGQNCMLHPSLLSSVPIQLSVLSSVSSLKAGSCLIFPSPPTPKLAIHWCSFNRRLRMVSVAARGISLEDMKPQTLHFLSPVLLSKCISCGPLAVNYNRISFLKKTHLAPYSSKILFHFLTHFALEALQRGDISFTSHSLLTQPYPTGC